MSATQAQADFAGLASAVFGSVLTALGDRPDRTPTRKQAAEAAVAHVILAFLPRDAMEMMFVSQAVLFHELTADAGHDVLSGLDPSTKRKAQTNAIALGRMVQQNFDRFLKLQARSAEGERDEPAQEEKPDNPAPDTVTPFTEEELLEAGFPPEEVADLIARTEAPIAPASETGTVPHGKTAIQLVPKLSRVGNVPPAAPPTASTERLTARAAT